MSRLLRLGLIALLGAMAGTAIFLTLRLLVGKLSVEPGGFGTGSYDAWPPVPPAKGKRPIV